MVIVMIPICDVNSRRANSVKGISPSRHLECPFPLSGRPLPHHQYLLRHNRIPSSVRITFSPH